MTSYPFLLTVCVRPPPTPTADRPIYEYVYGGNRRRPNRTESEFLTERRQTEFAVSSRGALTDFDRFLTDSDRSVAG